MPKKRQSQSLLTKPSSTAPAALSSARAGASQHEERPSNVNGLLQQLRLSQRPHENVLPPQTSIASVHPAVRTLLDLPDIAPPQPRPNTRPQLCGLSRMRRTAGPPPPKSWLSKHGSMYKPQRQSELKRVQHQAIALPEAFLVSENSLQNTLLKSLALNWNFHVERHQLYLTRIPLRLRETLLSYISLHKADDDQLRDPLRVLFPDSSVLPEDLETDDPRDVRRLDLGNALGSWLTFKTLRKSIFIQTSSLELVLPSAKVDTTDSEEDHAVEEIPESWEDASDESDSLSRQPLSSNTLFKSPTLRFQNLRHLSLALSPGEDSPAASWASLLSIASHLSTLESLSLARWPLPTYTPKAATTYTTISSNVTSPGPRFAYGGTNMYSSFDNDWRESSGILRSLSRALYCLKWLDLTGCVAWLPALVWEPIRPEPTRDDFGLNTSDLDEDTGRESMSMWNGYWRGITWLGLSVGWTPNVDASEYDTFARLSMEHAALQFKSDRVAMQIREKRIAGKGYRIEFG